jgi:hypothetical protein
MLLKFVVTIETNDLTLGAFQKLAESVREKVDTLPEVHNTRVVGEVKTEAASTTHQLKKGAMVAA